MDDPIREATEQPDLTPGEVEQRLREVLYWARARSVVLRNLDPVNGRAASLVATHTEDALRVLLLPVP